MKKLSLNLDELAVESFTTDNGAASRGTVLGNAETTGPVIVCSCIPYRTDEFETCVASCNGSCVDTCDASCYQTCDGTCDCGTNDFRCGASQPGQRICM